jgi:hypothetical protein
VSKANTEGSDCFVGLHRRFGCYRVERTSSRAGVAPAESSAFSRRTVTTIIRVHSEIEPAGPMRVVISEAQNS